MQAQAQSVAVVQPGEGAALWVLDHHYTIKLTSEDTNGAVGIFEGVIPPNSGPPPHIHQSEDELLYVLEGQISAFSVDRWFDVAAGGLVYLPKGTLHTFKNIGATAARVLAIVTPAGFEGFIAAVGRPVTDPSTTPEVTPADIDRLLSAAPDYNITFAPPA